MLVESTYRWINSRYKLYLKKLIMMNIESCFDDLEDLEKELMEFISLSEPVFAEVWNLPEDDIWDEF